MRKARHLVEKLVYCRETAAAMPTGVTEHAPLEEAKRTEASISITKIGGFEGLVSLVIGRLGVLPFWAGMQKLE